MTSRTDDQPRLPGTLITLDGPGGVGKSSAATRTINLFTAAGQAVHGTRQPSRTELGELARHGTDTYRGMSLACLRAADRHHQLDTEIKPALQGGKSFSAIATSPPLWCCRGLTAYPARSCGNSTTAYTGLTCP